MERKILEFTDEKKNKVYVFLDAINAVTKITASYCRNANTFIWCNNDKIGVMESIEDVMGTISNANSDTTATKKTTKTKKFDFVKFHCGVNAWDNEFTNTGKTQLRLAIQGKPITKKSIIDAVSSVEFYKYDEGLVSDVSVDEFYPEEGHAAVSFALPKGQRKHRFFMDWKVD